MNFIKVLEPKLQKELAGLGFSYTIEQIGEKQIYAFAEKFVDYYIEMDDNNDVYLCFYEYNEDTPCFLKDVLVANCQNEDLYYVKDCINKMQYPN